MVFKLKIQAHDLTILVHSRLLSLTTQFTPKWKTHSHDGDADSLMLAVTFQRDWVTELKRVVIYLTNVGQVWTVGWHRLARAPGGGARGGQNIWQWRSRSSQGTHGLIDTAQEFRVYLGHTWKPKKDDKRRRKSLIGLKIFFPRCLEIRWECVKQEERRPISSPCCGVTDGERWLGLLPWQEGDAGQVQEWGKKHVFPPMLGGRQNLKVTENETASEQCNFLILLINCRQLSSQVGTCKNSFIHSQRSLPL